MDNSEKTETSEVVEKVAQPVAPVQPTAPLLNIFKTTAPKVSSVVKEQEQVDLKSCDNCEDSGKTCSVCGFDRE